MRVSSSQLEMLLMFVRGKRWTKKELINELGVSYRTATRYMTFLKDSFPEACEEILDNFETVRWLPLKSPPKT